MRIISSSELILRIRFDIVAFDAHGFVSASGSSLLICRCLAKRALKSFSTGEESG
jgi:hypothetical protein